MRVEEVHHVHIDGGDGQLAIILWADDTHADDGLRFLTPPLESLQLATMNFPAGHTIAPHYHVANGRIVQHTQEVIVVQRGRLRVNLFGYRGDTAKTVVLGKGDTILLLAGGHGFEVIGELEAIYVKLGPYCGREKDKVVYESAT